MKREGQHPSDAEWKVLHALWRRHPSTARELLDGLHAETDWAYTTLKTLLGRMLEKGLVSEEMRGHTAWYEPAVDQVGVRRHALRAMIDRVFEGAAGPLLAHLVEHESLSQAERRQLAAWVSSAEKRIEKGAEGRAEGDAKGVAGKKAGKKESRRGRR
ncbi:MAG TPA: BlaI/MecI/CopY family transcriptional regulator [Planctomycetota bacterium]|nr:BlaI/MecI/CopY family transcriptional regulator [Planctomycetota bacterium]